METIVLSSRIWISKTVYTYILHMILRSTRTIINEKCLNGGAMSAWPAVATGNGEKILRMREGLGEKRCRVMEDKIRGHHRWAQINVNLADIFNGASLPLSLSLSWRPKNDSRASV